MKKSIENVSGVLEELTKEVEGCSRSTPLEEILEAKSHAVSGEIALIQDRLDTVARRLHLSVVGGTTWKALSSCLGNETTLLELIDYLEKNGEDGLAIFATDKVNSYCSFSTDRGKYLAIPA